MKTSLGVPIHFYAKTISRFTPLNLLKSCGCMKSFQNPLSCEEIWCDRAPHIPANFHRFAKEIRVLKSHKSYKCFDEFDAPIRNAKALNLKICFYPRFMNNRVKHASHKQQSTATFFFSCPYHTSPTMFSDQFHFNLLIFQRPKTNSNSGNET